MDVAMSLLRGRYHEEVRNDAQVPVHVREGGRSLRQLVARAYGEHLEGVPQLVSLLGVDR